MTRIGVNLESAGAFRPAFAAAVGTGAPPLDVDRIFVQTQGWGSGGWNDVVSSVQAGRVPIVSTKLYGSWASVADGGDDARLDGVVNGLIGLIVESLPLKPRLCFHHEPEGDGDPFDYNLMWSYLVSRYAKNLRAAGWDLSFIMMGGTFSGWTQWTIPQLEQAIGGIDVADLFADVYEKPGGTAPWASETKPYTPPDAASSPFLKYLDYCNAKGYNAGLGELGVNRRQSENATGAGQAMFLGWLGAWDRADEFEFACYYDRDVGEGGATSNTSIDSAAALRAFATLASESSPTPDCGDWLAEAEMTISEALALAQAAPKPSKHLVKVIARLNEYGEP